MRRKRVKKTSPPSTAKSLGERKLIDLIQHSLDIMPNMAIPFGDDVSAIDIENGKVAVLKTDMLVGKTDIPRSMSLWQAARKSVVMNVSDFAAKGTKPLAMLVSLGLPRDLNQKDVEEIARGLNAGAREYGTYIVGGDVNEASDFIASISLFGIAEKKSLMLRNGAKFGDIVAVTGLFGKTSAGLKLLLDGYAASKELHELLLSSVCMPRARLCEGLALSKSSAVSASIDSSDGLAWSLHEIGRMSDVGFAITNVPVAEEVRRFAEFNGLDAVDLAFYGGEEYELVVTIKPKLWEAAETAVREVGGTLVQIGKATKDQQISLDQNGEKRVIEARGWEHFKGKI